MVQFRPELITLKRSQAGRATGSRIKANILMQIGLKERPYISPIMLDDWTNEYWSVEKQFWLKYKREFQDIGFLPMDSYNKNKKIPSMMENF